MYDEKCHALAIAFLTGDPDNKVEGPLLEKAAPDLAQQIQDLIESFLEFDLVELRKEAAGQIKNAQGVFYETPYAVICDSYGGLACGRVCLTEEQYMRALQKPDAPWQCPKCGGRAEWDDSCPATNPVEVTS